MLEFRSDVKAEFINLRAALPTKRLPTVPRLDSHSVEASTSQSSRVAPPAIEEGISECPENQDTLVTKQRRNQKIARGRANITAYHVTISFPWFRKRWAIETTRAYQGWDFACRVRNIISYDSLIFKLAKAGDVAGLRALFEAKVASPFDVEMTCSTPLHVSGLFTSSSSTPGDPASDPTCVEIIISRKS